jgi:uncharacterized protein
MNPDAENPLPPETDRAAQSPESHGLDPAVPVDPAEILHSIEPAAPFDDAARAEEFGGSEFAVSTIPEDLRVPWGWVDLLLFVLLGISGLILLVVLFAMASGLFGGASHQLLKSTNTQNFVGVVVQALLDVALLGYLAAQMRLRFHLPFWRTIGWRPLESGKMPRWGVYLGLVLGGFFLAAAVSLVSAAFPPKDEMPIQEILQDRNTLILFALLAVIVAPVFEETLFRGYLYPLVARSFGMAAGIIGTGTVFGLLHAAQLKGGNWQIALMVVVGIIFTLARAATRTVVASYILHVSYNSIQVIALLIGTHGLRQMPSLH